MSEVIHQTGYGRLFIQPYGARPENEVTYVGRSIRLGGFDESLGDATPIREPSDLGYDRFGVADMLVGESGLPTTSIVARFGLANLVFRMKCPGHFQAHFGKCEDPTNFDDGWDTILAFEMARLTGRSSGDLTALDEADRAVIELTGNLTARRIWEVTKVNLAARGGAAILREVIDVTVSDFVACGSCGYQSDGNQRIFAVVKGSGVGSPGLPPELIISTDQGQTVEEYDITTLGATEDPSRVRVAGPYIIVPSHDSASLHVAELAAPGVWTEVAAGFAGKGLNGAFVASSTQVFLCADDGYVFIVRNPLMGGEVQTDGSVTAQDLYAIHGSSPRDIIAVGAGGAIIQTNNGGITWSLASATPTVDALRCCWMQDPYHWLVGDATGHLWYTADGGVNWHESVLPPSVVWTSVKGIAFAEHAGSPFGYLAANDAAQGYLLRTLNGGQTWYILPEGAGAIPDNDELLSVACGEDANFAVTGGLGADGEDGILIVAA